jgi:pimeloyl-ACP methyl ester carboxylesterase
MKRPFTETPFEIELGDGTLQGHFGGTGVPALLLHGGPGLPDYMQACAEELANLFTTVRYTQRGTLPSTTGGPYTVESHMADAIAILDLFEQEKMWAVGHSWGAHLALHLAVAHPNRLYGIACIDPLGASLKVLPDYRQALRDKLTPEQLARVDAIDELSEAGEATEEDELEQQRILWPAKFYDPATAPPFPIDHLGLECNAGTMASLTGHYEQQTLRKGLPKVRLPVLFAHGIEDPLPIRASINTAKLIPGARVARIAKCGHFPWLEQPGFLNRSLRGLIATL